MAIVLSLRPLIPIFIADTQVGRQEGIFEYNLATIYLYIIAAKMLIYHTNTKDHTKSKK